MLKAFQGAEVRKMHKQASEPYENLENGGTACASQLVVQHFGAKIASHLHASPSRIKSTFGISRLTISTIKQGVLTQALPKLLDSFCYMTMQAANIRSDMPGRATTSSIQQPPRIESTSSSAPEESTSFLDSIWNPIQTIAKRTAIYFAFLAAKQPSRIKQVLKQASESLLSVFDHPCLFFSSVVFMAGLNLIHCKSPVQEFTP